MAKNIRTQVNKVIGKSLNAYHEIMKPVVDDLKFKEQYQGRIVDCMVGEIDDNYIETPETDSPIVKLEYSKEGIVKIPTIKGKTILVDSDGNVTDTPGEGCRLVSVGEEESNKMIILSNNKNLFNGRLEDGAIMGSNGTSMNNSTRCRSEFIKVNANVVTVTMFTPTSYVSMFAYRKDGSYIGYSATLNDNSITLNYKDMYYVRVQFEKSDMENAKVQVNIGEKSNIYYPYDFNKTEILLDEPLRSLPNGVCDEIVDNKIIRRIGRHVFNEKQYAIGNESAGWKPQVDTIPFYLYQDRFEPIIENIKEHSLCYSATMPINKGFVNSDIEGLGVSGGSKIYIGGRIKRDRLESQDAKGVAKIINGTEFFYELAEPVIEELPNGITLQGFDDTTMYIENSITPTVTYGYNALIPYKQELSQQKEELEVNTLDIENNIIPYLMDMEFNLMLMEDK